MITHINDSVNIVTETEKQKLKTLLDKLDGSLSLGKDDVVTINTKPYGVSYKIELMVEMGERLMRSETVHDDFCGGVEISMLKLKDAIRRVNKNRNKSPDGVADTEDGKSLLQPYRTKTVPLIKMSVFKAIEEMELTGHDFYVFRDEEKGCVSMVYKRNDGRYGYIETE